MGTRTRSSIHPSHARINNRAGFTVTEGLVGLALMTIGTLSVAYISQSFNQTMDRSSIDKTNCVHQINTIFSALRAAGQVEGRGANLVPTMLGDETRRSLLGRDIWPDSATLPRFISGNAGQARSIYSAANTRPMIEFRPAGGGNDSAPAVFSGGSALRGNVRLIEHLYNLRFVGAAGADFCRTPNAMTPELQSLIDLASAPLRQRPQSRDYRTRIRIRPYDQLTGRLLTNAAGADICPGPLATSPMPRDMTASAYDTGMVRSKVRDRLSAAGNVTFAGAPPTEYVGYQVDVITTIPNVASCSGSTRFEHQLLNMPPPTPRIVAISRNTSLQAGALTTSAASRRNAGNSQNNVVEVTISARTAGATLVGTSDADAPMPPGTVLLCRDRSRVPDSRPRFACYGGPNGPGPQRFSGGPGALLPVTAVTNGALANYDVLADLGGVNVDGSWQPCESVPLCGRRPASSDFVTEESGVPYSRVLDANGRPTRRNLALLNRYEDLRADCIPQIEVRMINAAGQISGSAELSIETSDHRYERRNALAAEIARRECGNWCSLTGNRSFVVSTPIPAPGSGTNTQTYTIANDAYRVGGTPRRMRQFVPPQMPTGVNGYWQTGGCCVSPLPDDATALAGGAGLAAFTQNNRCRPGWFYAGAGTATSPNKGARTRSMVEFSTDDNARPRVPNLDNLDLTAGPNLLPWNDAPNDPHAP